MTTMYDLFSRYELEHLPTLAPRSQRDYRRHLVKLGVEFGNRDPASIKPKEIGRFLDVKKGKISRNRMVTILSHVFSKAIGKWFIDDLTVNPCEKVEKNPAHPRTRYITDDEYLAIYARAPMRVQVMMDLALLTGQRQGDLLRLKWEQVSREGICFQQGKTGRKLRVRPSVSLGYVMARARREINAGPQIYVIETREGKPYTSEGFRAKWQRVMREVMADKAIATRCTFHDIRAKVVSDSKSLVDAMQRAGHINMTMTRQVYDRGMRDVDPLV